MGPMISKLWSLSKVSPAKKMILKHIKQNKIRVMLGQYNNVGHRNSLKFNKVAVNDISTGKIARKYFFIENADKHMTVEMMFKRLHYNGFDEKEKIDGNIEQLSRMTRDFWIFWMQAERKMGTTRCHCYSNRKTSKFEIKRRLKKTAPLIYR